MVLGIEVCKGEYIWYYNENHTADCTDAEDVTLKSICFSFINNVWICKGWICIQLEITADSLIHSLTHSLTHSFIQHLLMEYYLFYFIIVSNVFNIYMVVAPGAEKQILNLRILQTSQTIIVFKRNHWHCQCWNLHDRLWVS